MKNNTRTQNTINNSLTGILLQIITSVLALIYRTILIRVLGVEYLGINGLFSNILNLLSLSELGFNIAIAYRMYEPASKNDYSKLGALLNFFEHIYKCVASIIFIIGLCLIPFLNFLIKDNGEIPNAINMYAVYIVMLIQSATSYLFTSRQILLQAYQKEYYNNIFQIISTILKYAAQIFILIVFKDYFLLLLIGIIIGIILNICYYYAISKKFKLIFAKKDKINKDEKAQIYKEVKALLMHKIGGVVLSSTDNLVISSILGLTVVGIYSNYTVVVSMIATIICKLLGGVTASVGNLKISNEREKLHDTFLGLNMLTMWVVSFCSVCLYCLINPFIELWLGEEYVLQSIEVLSIVAAFYIMYSRYMNTTFVNACGIYYMDKYRPIIEAFINLVISIICAKYIGLTGVFIGTVVSELVTAWWREPYLLYKHIFYSYKNVSKYSYMSIFFIASTFLLEIVCNNICLLLQNNWYSLFVKAFICLMIINIYYYIILRSKKEFYIIGNLLIKIKEISRR